MYLLYSFYFGALLVIIIHCLIDTMHIMVCLVVVNDLKQNSSKNVDHMQVMLKLSRKYCKSEYVSDRFAIWTILKWASLL